jgi:hypothetical protein
MKTTPGPTKTKSGQAKLHGLEKVTPRTIAYAALHVSLSFPEPHYPWVGLESQTRWFMCAEDDWRLDDGLFTKEEFFNTIVALFEQDPEDPWCVETLDWWNK